MKSTIKIDIDGNDVPRIVINCATNEGDLRDKALQSLLSKLGFEHAHWGQEATLTIKYVGWSGGGISYNTYDIYPKPSSAVVSDVEAYSITNNKGEFTEQK